MKNNLFVSYDLNTPNQNYPALIEEIKSLGDWAAIQRSVWYVNSNLNAEQAATRLRQKMDPNDSLIVVNASNNEAYWYNLSDVVTTHMKDFWLK